MTLGGDSPFEMVAAIVPVFGPMVAAVVVVKTTGRSLRVWIRSLGPVPGKARWYLAAVLLIGALVAITTAAYVVAGGELTVPAVTAPALLITFLIAMTLGGGPEELGWRGYLLPRLQQRWSPVGATLIVGLGWAIWHLPLFVLPGAQNAGQPFVLFALVVIAMSFAFTWLYNVANGSILPVVLLHGLNNTSGLLYPFAADTSWPSTSFRDSSRAPPSPSSSSSLREDGWRAREGRSARRTTGPDRRLPRWDRSPTETRSLRLVW